MKLGVNIDHVATLRQQRKEGFPELVYAALVAQEYGADSIVAHLREDRRHIQDRDIQLLKQVLKIPLAMEMAATEEMVRIALDVHPTRVCLVPEKRQELTTLEESSGISPGKPSRCSICSAVMSLSVNWRCVA